MAETAEGGGAQEAGGYDYKRLHSYPLIRVSIFASENVLRVVLKCYIRFYKSSRFFVHYSIQI